MHKITSFLFTGLLMCFSSAQAHTPLFDCFDNGDDTITCEGGFSDGSSAEGINVRVVDLQGKVLAQKVMGADGSVSFDLPNEEYSVIFAAGEGHSITIFSDDIY